MSDERNQPADDEALDQTQTSMSSEGQSDVSEEALNRVAGAPEPDLDPMQSALSKEAQIDVQAKALSDE